MGSPVQSRTGPTLVVIAFLDGRRTQGYIYDFSALRERCKVFPSPMAAEGEDVSLKQLKAIFFVEELAPDKTAPAAPGRKIEVLFSDGEKLHGTTQGYTPERLGFFIIPHDTGGEKFRILRIFIINANVKKVTWIR